MRDEEWWQKSTRIKLQEGLPDSMYHILGGICDDTEDTEEVEAECGAWVLGGKEVHVGINRLRMTGASLGIGT